MPASSQIDQFKLDHTKVLLVRDVTISDIALLKKQTLYLTLYLLLPAPAPMGEGGLQW